MLDTKTLRFAQRVREVHPGLNPAGHLVSTQKVHFWLLLRCLVLQFHTLVFLGCIGNCVTHTVYCCILCWFYMEFCNNIFPLFLGCLTVLNFQCQQQKVMHCLTRAIKLFIFMDACCMLFSHLFPIDPVDATVLRQLVWRRKNACQPAKTRRDLQFFGQIQ